MEAVSTNARLGMDLVTTRVHAKMASIYVQMGKLVQVIFLLITKLLINNKPYIEHTYY